MTDTWEQRMSARARDRWKTPVKRDPDAPVYTPPPDTYQDMTLEQARALLDAPMFGCACPGPPNCCLKVYPHARQMIATAGQVANVLDQATSA